MMMVEWRKDDVTIDFHIYTHTHKNRSKKVANDVEAEISGLCLSLGHEMSLKRA